MDGPIAIIGAGMCGLTCASALAAAGREVTIFDKSRGIGGRLATRRVGDLAFDHGAPHADGDDPAFRGVLGAIGADLRDGAGYGLPGMSGLLRPIADGLDIRPGAEVVSVRRGEGGWSLHLADGRAEPGFGAVVIAIPAPQAARVLPADGPVSAAALEDVRMVPVWALLAAFDARLDLPDLVPDAGDIARAERQSSRPGRIGRIAQDGSDAWVVHFTPAFTLAHLEAERDAVLPLLLDRFAAVAGPLPRAGYAAAHRWRFARTEVPLGAAFLGDPASGLLVGGDWALGPNAVHAWRSGRAMAGALLSA
jgi:predicted NAD/FAD-dependent oxidoreductase